MFGCILSCGMQSICYWKINSEQNRWRGCSGNCCGYGQKVYSHAGTCGGPMVYRALVQGYQRNPWHCWMHRWFSYSYNMTMCQWKCILQSQRFLQFEHSRYLAIHHALLILAVIDHRKCFIDLTVGWPGSVADGRVWANSALKANIENFLSPLPVIPIATVNEAGETINELVPAVFLGDSAYPKNARMVTTFKNTDCARCSVTKHLNQKLAGARYYVENVFGIC